MSKLSAHWSRCIFQNLLTDTTYRQDLAARRSKEYFIGSHEFFRFYLLFHGLETGYCGGLKYGKAGKTVEDSTKRRGFNHITFNPEDCLSASFGHEAIGIKHDSHIKAAANCLLPCQNTVYAITGHFGLNRNSIRVKLAPAAKTDAYVLLRVFSHLFLYCENGQIKLFLLWQESEGRVSIVTDDFDEAIPQLLPFMVSIMPCSISCADWNKSMLSASVVRCKRLRCSSNLKTAVPSGV